MAMATSASLAEAAEMQERQMDIDVNFIFNILWIFLNNFNLICAANGDEHNKCWLLASVECFSAGRIARNSDQSIQGSICGMASDRVGGTMGRYVPCNQNIKVLFLKYIHLIIYGKWWD